MKEYAGAVFFVDILGVGALTQGKIVITENDFLAHRFKYDATFSKHQFCARILLKFRRILVNVTKNTQNIKVAQLSDCAFIWSSDPDLVVNIARELMWKFTLGGILCRGGLASGQIVEPDKINTKLGMFICGSAVTDAVRLEGVGKGARIFVKQELVCELEKIPDEAFVLRKSLIDFSIIDEFKWYLYPEFIESKYDKFNKKLVVDSIIKLIATLQYSPKYIWNSSSNLGLVQLASSIDIISSELEMLTKNLDLKFNYEYTIDGLNQRNDSIYRKVLNIYKSSI
ncbi:hypothetical protein ETI71_07535 [Proteus mirabilis]|uniref:hypothetical protein n=1 Tax=Proteus mirabilis TaxID=584 RepID=UPI0019D18EBA|nr:hypothetical protein [Proteus mirabilis]MBN7226375.1 hypothetical protein [Proteus mirabilis]MBN7246776.1 hypothetical protein [Proteus mirabilis]MBN7261256.1 hypothetical protein [Proteus mirabilis]MBN7271469.1 hypothetical protein [Proteus mirabilis]HEK2763327.1 hypothetical protein [Proteus mirabilis]